MPRHPRSANGASSARSDSNLPPRPDGTSKRPHRPVPKRHKCLPRGPHPPATTNRSNSAPLHRQRRDPRPNHPRRVFEDINCKRPTHCPLSDHGRAALRQPTLSALHRTRNRLRRRHRPVRPSIRYSRTRVSVYHMGEGVLFRHDLTFFSLSLCV